MFLDMYIYVYICIYIYIYLQYGDHRWCRDGSHINVCEYLGINEEYKRGQVALAEHQSVVIPFGLFDYSNRQRWQRRCCNDEVLYTELVYVILASVTSVAN